MITQEQMILIQQLISSPAFINLRQQAQTNPENIPALLQMLQQNYPSLFALFNQNPQLLIAILAGDFNADQIQNADLGDADPENLDEYEDAQPTEELTPQDHQAIQSVNLSADGDGLHSAAVHRGLSGVQQKCGFGCQLPAGQSQQLSLT